MILKVTSNPDYSMILFKTQVVSEILEYWSCLIQVWLPQDALCSLTLTIMQKDLGLLSVDPFHSLPYLAFIL